MKYILCLCVLCVSVLGRLRFHYDNDNEYENEFSVCLYLHFCVIPGFLLFVIVEVDDEMEAISCSFLCVQQRNENDSDISLSFSYS